MKATIHIAELTEEQMNEELEKGWRDVLAGRCKDAETVFLEILSAPDNQDSLN